MDDVNSPISFRLSDSCAGDVEEVEVGLYTDNGWDTRCLYDKDDEQYVARVVYEGTSCGYDNGTGVFTVAFLTGELSCQTRTVRLRVRGRAGNFTKEFRVTVKGESLATDPYFFSSSLSVDP
eukprot:TRINITY_DN18309_c0_g1_i1.p1 TRINITY_DN18309_c0_g1~~TRINITY_DN18309_c0_g1_i1.p1  ORF type:complete len:122 (-),score=22.88 TRINITY_DN18309_c0_g1_i1:155-520(-)